MIVEGAFLKLPELLLGHSFPTEQYEATLTNHFAMGVLLELSARNIELPMHRVHIERPYPVVSGARSPGRADLHVDLVGLFTKGLYHNLYGMKEFNWVEAKFFGGIGRQHGHQTKVTNAAMIALDLLRLCLFVEEKHWQNRPNARYLALVFNRDPKDYLPFHRRDSNSPKREWLNLLLLSGENRIHISLKEEPKSFRKVFGNGFVDDCQNLDLKLRVLTRTFSPIETPVTPLYWGYLVRVVDFEISFGNDMLIYEDASTEFWSEANQHMQQGLIERFLEMQQA